MCAAGLALALAIAITLIRSVVEWPLPSVIVFFDFEPEIGVHTEGHIRPVSPPVMTSGIRG